MNPVVISMIVFACTFVHALLGMWLRTVLPVHHFDDDTKDTIKVGVGLVATMTALVLGLITASAKNSFDTLDTAVKQTSVEILTLDRTLARYGTDTGEIRKALKQTVENRIAILWPDSTTAAIDLDPMHSGGMQSEKLVTAIQQLSPANDSQRALQSHALEICESLLQTRWLLLDGNNNSIPVPFLVVLLFWLAITFTSFGLFAPRNATVVAVLLVCSMSVGSAVFLVLEMGTPFNGVIRISSVPLHNAVAHLDE